MIAWAPGKAVISGAYSVLEGAPAIVCAVDRYVRVDGSKPASFVTDEVRQAIEAGFLDFAPDFDASALRRATPDGGSRKLGLGSSAAILAASIAARFQAGADEVELRKHVLEAALAAHRSAQGGGSGIDVAASVHGGFVLCRKSESGLVVEPHAMPPDLCIEVFASEQAASTPSFLAHVRAFRDRTPLDYAAVLRDASDAAESAARAVDGASFIAAIDAQAHALGELGRRTGVDIVTDTVARLATHARNEGGLFAPSGAGGGDIALFLGVRPSSKQLRALAESLGLEHLPIQVGARGLYRSDAPRNES
jgi:phosphomevalonate kinase